VKRIGIIAAAGIVLAVLCFGGCDHDVATPTPNTPINELTLTKYGVDADSLYGPDSLKVSFGTTVGYSRATLSVRPQGQSYHEIDEIAGMSPKEFRFRWTDWFCSTPDVCDAGYVSVKIYYGSNETTEYAWFVRFEP
jgi:hypothetical protein